MKEKILNNLIYMITVTIVILLVVFKDNMKVIAVILSIGLIMVGICLLLQKKKVGVLSFSGGLSLLISYLLNVNKILIFVDSFTFFICSSVLFMLVSTFVVEIFNRKAIYKKYNMVVEAQVIDLERNPNSKKEFYRPIYEYIINDIVYQVAYIRYIDKLIPNIGDRLKILVMSEDHQEIYFLPEKQEEIKNLIVGLFLVVASIIIIIGLF